MLLACQLVNLTSWNAQAKEAFRALALRYDGPSDLSLVEPEDLHEVLRPLGLWRRRASTIVKFSKAWVERGSPADAKEVLKRPGCGHYASQSWAIFVDGVVPDDPIVDHKLSWYLERTRDGNQHSQEGCKSPLGQE